MPSCQPLNSFPENMCREISGTLQTFTIVVSSVRDSLPSHESYSWPIPNGATAFIAADGSETQEQKTTIFQGFSQHFASENRTHEHIKIRLCVDSLLLYSNNQIILRSVCTAAAVLLSGLNCSV